MSGRIHARFTQHSYKKSPWKGIKTGVSQGFLTGLVLLLIYINEMPDGLNEHVKSLLMIPPFF